MSVSYSQVFQKKEWVLGGGEGGRGKKREKEIEKERERREPMIKNMGQNVNN